MIQSNKCLRTKLWIASLKTALNQDVSIAEFVSKRPLLQHYLFRVISDDFVRKCIFLWATFPSSGQHISNQSWKVQTVYVKLEL